MSASPTARIDPIDKRIKDLCAKAERAFASVVVLPVRAQQQQQSVPAQQPPSTQTESCITVVDAGSHAFRNTVLRGIAGAVISKTQYKLVDSVNYPAHDGQKFHGNDLQMMQSEGVHVTILDKK